MQAFRASGRRMRRPYRSGSTVLLLLAAVLLAVVPSVATGASPNDSATGSGRVADLSGASSDFSFAAHSGAAGANAKGNLTSATLRTSRGTTARRRSRACSFPATTPSWSAPGREDGPFGPTFPHAVLFVEDNGQPSGDTPDRGIAFGATSGTSRTGLRSGTTRRYRSSRGTLWCGTQPDPPCLATPGPPARSGGPHGQHPRSRRQLRSDSDHEKPGLRSESWSLIAKVRLSPQEPIEPLAKRPDGLRPTPDASVRR